MLILVINDDLDWLMEKAIKLDTERKKRRSSFRNWDLVTRIQYGLTGIQFAWREERGFRNQVYGLMALFLVLLIIQPPLIWWGITLLAALIVLSLEIFNTALEALIDKLHPDYHPVIGKVKDLACGAVIVASVGLFLIGIVMIADSLS